jgi:DNA polymerase-3 subunit alpha (Gram-positive type)
LVKIDILGHDAPTMLKILHELTGINPLFIPSFDPQVLSLFSSTNAFGIDSIPLGNNKQGKLIKEPSGILGITEFGTPFVRAMLREVQLQRFSDLVQISGLSHGKNV